MANTTYKGRVLFLHGFTQSSSVFYAKTSALRKKLNKLQYKCVYLNGPIKLTPAQLPSSDALSLFDSKPSDHEETNYRAWWIKKDYTKEGLDVSKAQDTIKDYVDNGTVIPDEDMKGSDKHEEHKDLPIVGLIGFSQGAALAGLICHKFNTLFGVDTLKFVILYSGFKVDTGKKSAAVNLADYYTSDEGVSDLFKILNVFGELDTVISEDRCLQMYEVSKKNSDILKHPGGHFVPNSKLYIEQVCNWIQKLDVEDEKKDDKSEKDDLDSLMDMMDNLGKA